MQPARYRAKLESFPCEGNNKCDRMWEIHLTMHPLMKALYRTTKINLHHLL